MDQRVWKTCDITYDIRLVNKKKIYKFMTFETFQGAAKNHSGKFYDITHKFVTGP